MKWLSVKASRLMTIMCHKIGRSGSAWPGAAARAVDPWILKKLAKDVREGIIVVTSTNGKTTVNNLIYNVLKANGKKVVCNLEGANMNNGVITAFLRMANSKGKVDADWATLEVDELFTRKIVKKVKPDYLVLNNLVRDQLDRCGELDTVAETIIKALSFSPETIVIYNSDDPLVSYVAKKSGHKTITFSASDVLHNYDGKDQNGHFCRECGTQLDYDGEHYGRLGKFYCPKCGFAHAAPDYNISNLDLNENGSDFSINTKKINTNLNGIYNVYNVLAAYSVTNTLGIDDDIFKNVVSSFSPDNGRMQHYSLQKPVMLNLIKNPDGTNQVISVVMQDKKPKVIIIIINDHDNDGNDPSWLWDADFERLSDEKDNIYFACGIRKNDLQVRLKYAEIKSELCDTVKSAINKAFNSDKESIYILSNYSSLASTKNLLDKMEKDFSKEEK